MSTSCGHAGYMFRTRNNSGQYYISSYNIYPNRYLLCNQDILHVSLMLHLQRVTTFLFCSHRGQRLNAVCLDKQVYHKMNTSNAIQVHTWSPKLVKPVPADALQQKALNRFNAANICPPEIRRCVFHNGPDSKVHGASMGPTWVLSAPDGPHVGPMNLAIRGGGDSGD